MRTKLASAVAILLAIGAWQGLVEPSAVGQQPTPQICCRVGIPISSLPYTITKPGYYYLTRDLTGVFGKNGIIVDADNVYIDLNGFTIRGVAGSLRGITVGDSLGDNLTIVNGVVEEWDHDGIVTRGDAHVERVAALKNGRIGLRTLRLQNRDTDVHILNCRVGGNGSFGISMERFGTVKDCLVYENASDGIHLQRAATVVNCLTRNNTGHGILASAGSTIRGCASYANGQDGFNAAQGVVVESTSHSNNGWGFVVPDCLVAHCCSLNNGAGNYTGSGANYGDNK